MKKLSYILLMLVFSLSFALPVDAAINTKERLESENYGVNKHFMVTPDNLDDIKNTPYVDASESIYDDADILSDSDIEQLKKLVVNFQEHTNMDIVIYTYRKDIPYDTNNEIGANFYDYNDFGMKFDDDYSGILLIRNASPTKAYYVIFSFGNAQFYLNKARIDNILDKIDMYIASRNYYDAFSTFITMSQTYIDEGKWEGYQNYYLDENQNLIKKYTIPFLGVTLASLIITAIIIYILVKQNKMVARATNARQYIDVDNIDINVRQEKLTSSNTSTYVISSSSSSGGSGRGTGSSGGGHTSSGRRG